MATPKIWSRFRVTRKCDGVLYKFLVQEAIANDKKAVLEFLKKYMIPNETYNKAAGTARREDSIYDMMEIYNYVFDTHHVMLVYEDKESETDKESNVENPIVAINLMMLDEGQEDDLIEETLKKVKTPEVKKFLHIAETVENLHNERKMLGLDRYYAGLGVCVRPEFAGLGIAKELLKLRREVSKAHGVPATGAWMTAIGSQRAAASDGWKTEYEIPFEELGKLCECEFVGAPPTLKLMVAYV
ncbi:hypothetical protein NE865_00362 [Phthorimaea operculella]|nr:hypothetical protein NE865_00362 [Phthorimaea operculella]